MNTVLDSRMAATGSAPEAAPGERLARARQEQGLSTGEVGRQLKLSPGQIEALESGDYGSLPGPIFVRGFIRNYARLLKLDPEELLRAAAADLPPAAASPEPPPSRNIPFPSSEPRRWRKAGIAAAVIVALLAVYEFYWNEPAAVVTPPQEGAAKAAAAQPAPERPARPAPAARQAGPSAARATPEPGAPAPALQEASAGQARQPRPDEREVRFFFDEESWIEVYDRDNKPIFYQIGRAGSSRRVIGVPPLRIVVGYAHGVRMLYAGQPVDLARYTKIDVARLTLE